MTARDHGTSCQNIRHALSALVRSFICATVSNPHINSCLSHRLAVRTSSRSNVPVIDQIIVEVYLIVISNRFTVNCGSQKKKQKAKRAAQIRPTPTDTIYRSVARWSSVVSYCTSAHAPSKPPPFPTHFPTATHDPFPPCYPFTLPYSPGTPFNWRQPHHGR